MFQTYGTGVYIVLKFQNDILCGKICIVVKRRPFYKILNWLTLQIKLICFSLFRLNKCRYFVYLNKVEM